jgi:hypothetical protein
MALDQWVDTSQFTPTPGNFRSSPTFPVDYASPQQIVSQKSILLLRFDDGVEVSFTWLGSTLALMEGLENEICERYDKPNNRNCTKHNSDKCI